MLKRTACLKRSPMPPRQHPLAPHSQKQGKQVAAQKLAYGAAGDERRWCSVCGQPGETEHAHLFTQRQRPDLANHPQNWIIVGKHCACHSIQENNKPEFARRYPEAWRRICWQMEVLDPVAFAAFRLKNPF